MRLASPPDPMPPLDRDATAHAARVAEALRAAVRRADGALPFDQYMELALYAPGLGYYAAGARKLGVDGDFITAPEVSSLFGRALARQVAEALAAADGDTLLELGPGSGALAAALLPELVRLGAAPARCLLLEPSPDLRERQRARLAPLGLPTELTWLERLPETPVSGVIIANEVLDALPCERFVVRDDGARELAVSVAGDGFALVERPARRAVAEAVAAIEAARGAPFSAGYAHELRRRLPPWVAAAARALGRGMLLFIDYGLGRRELYAPQRAAGTFRVHHRHRALDDALFRPGLSDLTAWVDFTAVAEAATDEGLELGGYTTQAHLLLGCGLGELLAEPMTDPVAQAVRSRDAQLLTLPDEMGERFKAIAFTRGTSAPLRGFAIRDLAHLL